MTDKQPLGPALAHALGGEWLPGARTIRLDKEARVSPFIQAPFIWANGAGHVYLREWDGEDRLLGTMSDGVDALAQAARNHGVGT